MSSKMFGGKQYEMVGFEPNKQQAELKVLGLRAKGKSARYSKNKAGYAIYAKSKK